MHMIPITKNQTSNNFSIFKSNLVFMLLENPQAQHKVSWSINRVIVSAKKKELRLTVTLMHAVSGGYVKWNHYGGRVAMMGRFFMIKFMIIVAIFPRGNQ